MRRTLGFLALGGLVAVGIAQVSGGLLSGFAKALSAAPSVSSTYTVQVIGSTPESYSVALKKPNLARIDTPQFVVVADGKQITRYDKAGKVYYKEPQSDAAVKALFASDELGLFAGFFSEDAYKAASMKSLGQKNRKGQIVNAIQANVDSAGKKQITYFVGSDNIARAAQFDLNDPKGKMTYILDTKTFELGGDLPSNTFAFVPPQDSKEITLEELNADKWYTNLDEARAAAQKSNKMILVDFYADW